MSQQIWTWLFKENVLLSRSSHWLSDVEILLEYSQFWNISNWNDCESQNIFQYSSLSSYMYRRKTSTKLRRGELTWEQNLKWSVFNYGVLSNSFYNANKKIISALLCRVTPNMPHKCHIDFQVTHLHCYTSIKRPNFYGTFQLLLICSFASIISKLITSLLSFNL